MDIFISYSNADKVMAHSTKVALREFGMEGFLAHEDLQVSDDWRDAILEKLKTAPLFIALLSTHFRVSEWCAQEIGFVVSRPEVLIIPLSIDGTTPFGFISKFQSKRVNSADDIPKLLQDILLKKRPRLAIPCWIQKVMNVGSYRSAETLVKPLVPYFPSFTSEEAIDFIEAALGNSQVWDAGDCRGEYLPAFARLHWHNFQQSLKNDFLSKLELEEPELIKQG